MFSLTPAVLTALQYTVSNRIFDEDHTEQGYIYHVMTTSFGTIAGPVIGGKKGERSENDRWNILGLLLDMSGSYKSIIPTSILFLFISFISFGATILLLNKKSTSEVEDSQTASIHQHDNAAYGSSY